MRTGTAYWNAWHFGGHFGGHFGIHLATFSRTFWTYIRVVNFQMPSDSAWAGWSILVHTWYIHIIILGWAGAYFRTNIIEIGGIDQHPALWRGIQTGTRDRTQLYAHVSQKKSTRICFFLDLAYELDARGGEGAPTWWPGVGFFTCYIMRPSVSHGSPKWESGIEIECNFLKGLISQRYSCDGYPETTWSNYSWTQVFQQIFGCIYRVAVKLQINIIIE